jgi:UDP-N-acetylmuramate dehydrogenase
MPGDLKMQLSGVVENEPLRKHTTFQIGGLARYFFDAKREIDITDAINAATALNIPFFILGGGSNVLFSDAGFDGLIIKVSNAEMYFDEKGMVEAGAGVPLAKLVRGALERGFAGLEFAAGIPGTLGGAIYGNAGLGKDGPWISNVLKYAVLQMPDGEIKEADGDWLELSYRHSKLKDYSPKNRPVILSAVLQLTVGNAEELRKYIEEKVSMRAGKYPTEPSAGCIFKNPLEQSAASLIDQCGLKGTQIGGAKISERHANFIVNIGNAKASDVLELIKIVKEKVKEKFGIELEEEVQKVGF